MSKKPAERVLGITRTGKAVTEAIADQLADEAERGFDISDWTVVYPGRPSLTGEHAESPRVTFRVTPDIRNRAAARAEREGKSVSQVARDALESYLSAG